VNRRTSATLILTAWAGALGWLVQRHYFGTARASDQPGWPVPPSSAFHAIRVGTRQHGLASLTVDTIASKLQVTELVTLDLPPLTPEATRRTTYRIMARYSRGLQLEGWQGDLLTEQGRLQSTGAVSGDTLLRVVNTAPTELPETLTVPLRRPVILPSAIPLVAASRGLPRPGSKLNLEIYDPLDQELRTERMMIAAESVFSVPDSADYSETLRRWRIAHSDTVRAWRLDAVEHGLTVSRWVDASGQTVRVEHPLGAILERSAFEIVNSNYRALKRVPWDSGSTVPSYLETNGKEAALRSLRVVAHVDPDQPLPAGLPSLEGGWQERSGDTLLVAPRAAVDTGPEPPVLVEALIDQDTAMARIAGTVTGRDPRPEGQVRALTDWVRRTITLRTGAGGTTAGRTLARRSGTSEERVRLLVALARSVGFEARPVWGLARIDRGWQLRTWAEIRTGTWTPADPALSAREAPAGRIRLATGGRPRLLDLALRAGRLRLEVLEDTP
jgi:transglutaminase-like putative cysteine protease